MSIKDRLVVTNGDSGKSTKCCLLKCQQLQTSRPHLNKYLVFDCCLIVSHPDCVCRSATACLQINYKQTLDTEKKWFYTANIISNQRAACCCNFAAIKVVVVELGNTGCICACDGGGAHFTVNANGS